MGSAESEKVRPRPITPPYPSLLPQLCLAPPLILLISGLGTYWKDSPDSPLLSGSAGEPNAKSYWKSSSSSGCFEGVAGVGAVVELPGGLLLVLQMDDILPANLQVSLSASASANERLAFHELKSESGGDCCSRLVLYCRALGVSCKSLSGL